MSKRRSPGEIVVRCSGSGFLFAAEPRLVRVPERPQYDDAGGPGSLGEAAPCILDCGDPDCREWANLQIVGGEHDGHFLYHISECEMSDPESSDLLSSPEDPCP